MGMIQEFKIDSEEQSERLQKVLFKLGYTWRSGRVSEHTDEPYLCTWSDKSLTFSATPCSGVALQVCTETFILDHTEYEFENLYFKVTPKQSAELQEICFKLGYKNIYGDSEGYTKPDVNFIGLNVAGRVLRDYNDCSHGVTTLDPTDFIAKHSPKASGEFSVISDNVISLERDKGYTFTTSTPSAVDYFEIAKGLSRANPIIKVKTSSAREEQLETLIKNAEEELVEACKNSQSTKAARVKLVAFENELKNLTPDVGLIFLVTNNIFSKLNLVKVYQLHITTGCISNAFVSLYCPVEMQVEVEAYLLTAKNTLYKDSRKTTVEVTHV